MGQKQSEFQDSQKKKKCPKGSSGKGHSQLRIPEEEISCSLPQPGNCSFSYHQSTLHMDSAYATGKAKYIYILKIYTYIYIYILLFKAAPAAYGGSQARGPIGAVATRLCHSHSHGRSESHLRLTPQLTAAPDP